jgi:hypothetical protein
MLNLNYNINPSKGPGNCRGEVKFNYSASLLVVGGGGGGASGDSDSGVLKTGGGGGGAGIYTGSISIVPNVIYNIIVGTGGVGGPAPQFGPGVANGTNGTTSSFVGFDDSDTNLLSISASGGFGGLRGNGTNGGVGGNSGTLTINGLLISSSKAGGAGGATTGGAGGGASMIDVGDVGGVGGSIAGGGNGGLAIYNTIIANPDFTVGGGGGGGSVANPSSGDLGPAGLPDPNGDPRSGGAGGGAGNTTGTRNADDAISFGGGGGGGATTNIANVRSAGGDGSNGVVIIKYAGEPKAFVTNATTTTSGGFTTHTFNTGTGTFLYTYPYPWPDVVPYTVEVCPDEHNEDVRPEIYWDLTYSTIQSRFPAVPVIVSSSYATMSIDAVNSNCINVTTINNSVFTTNAQSTVKASLTGSNWPSTGSVTMSLSVAGITYDPLSTNQFYSASFSASSDVYNTNPSITGSIISSSFIASEFYRFYVNGSVTHRFGGDIPRNGLIQILDASNQASYPGSGSIWYDISGYNHNMSSSFGATFPSYNNNQFNFNGINNAVSTFITSSLNAFSLVTWTKIGSLAPIPTSSRSGGAYSITTGSGNFGTQFDSLTFDENRQDKWEIATEQNNRDVRSSVQETVASLDEYVMISMTNAGLDGTQKLYRNSTLVATGSFGSQYTSSLNLVLVGSRYYTFPSGSTPGSYAPEGFYTGSIVSCLLYNRELSDIDILDIFNAGAFTN